MDEQERHNYHLFLMKLYLNYAIHEDLVTQNIKAEFDRMIEEKKLLYKNGFYKVNPKKRYFKEAIEKHFEKHRDKLLTKGN